MSALQSSGAQTRFGFALLLVLLWNAGGTILMVLFPGTVPILPLLCAIVPVAWYWIARGRLPPLSMPSPPILVLALISAYLLANATLSLNPDSAYRAVGIFLAITGIMYVLLNVLADIDKAVVRAMAMGLIAGMVVSGVVLCVEAFSGQAIRGMLSGPFPVLRRDMRVLPDGTTAFWASLINKNVTEFTLLFWPSVMIIERLGLSKWRAALVLLALSPGLAALLRSEHATSKVAFAGAAVLYALYKLYPLVARRLAVSAWVAAVALVVPLASLAFSQQLYSSAWLFPSAQHRIVIWGYTSEQIAKAPLLGAGIATARVINEREKPQAKIVPGTIFQFTPSLHSHNAYLQIWYEAGALGALLLLGLGLVILRSLARSEPWAQPYLHATFAICALTAASSFSIWAPWLIASFAIVTIAAVVGSALPTPAVHTQSAA